MKLNKKGILITLLAIIICLAAGSSLFLFKNKSDKQENKLAEQQQEQAKEKQPLPFIASFENNSNKPMMKDNIEWNNNVTGLEADRKPKLSISSDDNTLKNNSALLYSGYANGGSGTNIAFKLYDVNIPVSSFTTLDYWIYPEDENAKFVAIDLHFTDGSSLRDSAAIDQNGYRMHPSAAHGGNIPLNAWTEIKSEIGQCLSGKVIDKILVEYDRQGYKGEFKGYLDNITISDDKVFSTGFELAQVQPVQKNYPETNNNIEGLTSEGKPVAEVEEFKNSHTGKYSLRYAGSASGTQAANISYRVFEEYINVSESTVLDYWIYPQNDNGRYAGIDIMFTDGTNLRDSGALDVRGKSLHPLAGHGGDIPLNNWSEIKSNIGAWAKGKTISKIFILYERPSSKGQFSGYLDDIRIYDEAKSEVSAGPSSPDIKYFGRWDNSSPSTYKSYFAGAYFKVNFTGTTAKIKLAGPTNIYAKIDNGEDVLINNANGIVDLTPVSLPAGEHSLRISSKSQDDVMRFQGLILDKGAGTISPEVSTRLIEFIGDSITEGFHTSKESQSSYAWKTAELLGAEHTQIAYIGITLKDGVKHELTHNIGMQTAYFKLQPSETHQYSPYWDFNRYKPTDIVINLGTNDNFAKVSNKDFKNAYIEFLENIRANNPSAEIYVLRTFGNLDNKDGFMTEPTQQAVKYIINKGDKKLHYVDTNGWLTEQSDFADNVHPSDQGHDKAADRLVQILK